MTIRMTRRVVMAAAAVTLAITNPVFAGGHQVMDEVNFLIPGGAGGGWDGTARGTCEALTG
ncbi:MAG: tripartite tricarboxylate transporter substrate binding protein, partial [Pseudomonadota bacterium]